MRIMAFKVLSLHPSWDPRTPLLPLQPFLITQELGAEIFPLPLSKDLLGHLVSGFVCKPRNKLGERVGG